MTDIWRGKRIVVTGGGGFIGRRLVEMLTSTRAIDVDQVFVPRSVDYDLRVLDAAVEATRNADIILHLAADVGGLPYSTNHHAFQFRNNSLIDLQVIEAARVNNVTKIVNTSSACAYPRDAEYPLTEDQLYTGLPQESNRGYGLAKRMTVNLSRFYQREHGVNAVTVIPTNAYGPGDDFDLSKCHVIPAMIRKCHETDRIDVWGDGSATRDFLFVDDFANGIIRAAEALEGPEPVNLGSGHEISIKNLVNLVAELCQFRGELHFDASRPAGQPRRVLDIASASDRMGWQPMTELRSGIERTISWFRENVQES